MLGVIILYVIIPLLVVIYSLIFYARWNYGSLEKQGFTVVPPDDFLLGSALLTYQKPGGLVDIELMRKYGSCYGLYEGREAQIFISDPELIRKVTTKDSDYFDSKRPINFNDPLFNEFPDFQVKNKWRVLRNLLNPVLSSSARLKAANPAMREAINDFIADVKKRCLENGGRVEKFCSSDEIFGMLTDLIARSLFSLDLKTSGYGKRFVQLVKMLMQPPANSSPWIASYVYAFPFISKFLPNAMINPEPSKEFQALLRQMIQMRKKERANGAGPGHKDHLDTLIEWWDKLGTEEFKKNNITEVTILSQGIALFIASQDQIALILSGMLKHLSEIPEIEKKVHEEVDKVFAQHNGILDHESLSDLTYLTACVTEATRLYPFFFRAERVCTKDWKDEERGIQIKKGNVVQIAIWATHRNPENFKDGDEFRPERFLPGEKEKIHPYANASFGFGPRNCVGKRLATEIMILLSAHLVKHLRFLKRKDTQLTFVPAGPFFGVSEPVYFDVEARSEE